MIARSAVGAPTLLLMARSPLLGRVKSRLAASTGDARALTLQIAFLRDTADLMTRAGAATGARLAVAWTAAADLGPELAAAFGSFTRFVQPAGCLGTRLLAMQRAAYEAHGGPIVALGGDSPTLPVGHLVRAIAALADHEIVLAPATDGGYVLLGVRQPRPELLRDMPWGTAEVAARTRAAARAAGWSWTELEAWYDVDDEEGLRRLTIEVGAGRAPEARWTTRALALPALALGG